MADAHTPRPTLRLAFLAIALLLVAVGVLLRLTAPDPEMKAAVGVAPALVQTLRVTSQLLRPRVRLTGVLDPRRRVELFAETSGGILEVGAEELDWVAEGQVLVRGDPLLARVALERAEAAVARTTSELALARLNLERRRSLVKRQVASEADLDVAENGERIAAAALREARAQRDEARDQLAKKTIRAPFAGVLRSFPVEEGEYVREGERIAELLDLSTVRVTVGVSDREVVVIHAGVEVEVGVEAYPGKTFRGRILRVGAASDAETKKFPLEVEVENPDRRLLPGMVVRVILDLGDPSPVTLIPRDVALDEFGLRFVYVIESNGAADVARRRRVVVRNVPFRPSLLQVLEGLEPGEEVVASGMRQLRDGALVQRKVSGPR